jgi:hypothetical protein
MNYLLRLYQKREDTATAFFFNKEEIDKEVL